MKAMKRIRALRALAIAGSLSALVVPAAAVALPPTDIPYAQQQQQAPQVQLPVRHENQPLLRRTAQQPFHSFTLPANYRPEVQAAGQPPRSFTLSASYKPEVQTPSSPVVASSPGSVIREIRTVTDNGSPTLAIVLAALALAIALCGTAYAWVRMSRMQRNLSSRPLAS